MSKKKANPPERFQTPSRNWHEPHIILFNRLLQSQSWHNLSHGARDLYILLLSQYKGVFTGNKVKCPYTDIINYGFGRANISKYLKELELEGFIDIESGGFSRVANIYHFSDRWIDKQ